MSKKIIKYNDIAIDSECIYHNDETLKEFLSRNDDIIYQDYRHNNDNAISLNGNSMTYIQFNLPVIAGYTCIGATLQNVNGSTNGYCLFSHRIQSPTVTVTIYNTSNNVASLTYLTYRFIFKKNK